MHAATFNNGSAILLICIERFQEKCLPMVQASGSKILLHCLVVAVSTAFSRLFVGHLAHPIYHTGIATVVNCTVLYSIREMDIDIMSRLEDLIWKRIYLLGYLSRWVLSPCDLWKRSLVARNSFTFIAVFVTHAHLIPILRRQHTLIASLPPHKRIKSTPSSALRCAVPCLCWSCSSTQGLCYRV